ncbi:DUF2786 domain-containing protein [Roseibium sp. RKSG952]|nr:DUF2786 domain-containing protein [Roseibium sp. RKSG952]MTH95343.1 DUF2786 domain-containing protein [Roseibium sp. RKSG952]
MISKKFHKGILNKVRALLAKTVEQGASKVEALMAAAKASG